MKHWHRLPGERLWNPSGGGVFKNILNKHQSGITPPWVMGKKCKISQGPFQTHLYKKSV